MEVLYFFLLLVITYVACAWANDQFTSGGYGIVADQVQTYLADSDLRLFVNNVTVSPNLVIGSLTQASFTGYAAKNYVTVPAPVKDPTNGGVSIFLGSNVFAASADIDPAQTVYGWYLTDTGGALIAAGNLPTPIQIRYDGDSVPIQVTLNFPG